MRDRMLLYTIFRRRGVSLDRCLVDCRVFLLVIGEYGQWIILHVYIMSAESMTLNKLMLYLDTLHLTDTDGYRPYRIQRLHPLSIIGIIIIMLFSFIFIKWYILHNIIWSQQSTKVWWWMKHNFLAMKCIHRVSLNLRLV